MLRALTGERGAPGGRTDDETARRLVAGGPEGIAGALVAEHRVEDVDRDQRLAVRGYEVPVAVNAAVAAGLVDAHVHDLALRAFLVRQEQLAVDGGVVLAVRVVDLR